MSVDIKAIVDQLYNDFKTSILSAVTSDAPDVIAAATSYVTNGEHRLKGLALGVLNPDVNEKLAYDFVIRRLKEEVTTLKDALIGIEQMIASDIEVLVNNLILIFENLLKKTVLDLFPDVAP